MWKKFNSRFIIFIVCIILPECTNINRLSEKFSNRDRLFNLGWKFIRDSIPGAEKPEYDDSQWIVVDLPHDFSITDISSEDTEDQIGPFSKNVINGNGTGFTVGGTGWYRKRFVIDKDDKDKRVFLKFDGVYMETEVWVNGKKAGYHKNGYTPFWFDITPMLNPAGEPNIVAVKVDNKGANSRWYSGSGIYRNVNLILTDPVHVDVWGAKITTPEINSDNAIVDVEVTVVNEKETDVEARITVHIKDKKGTISGISTQNMLLPAKSKNKLKNKIRVSNPVLWSLEFPHLYEAVTTIMVGRKVRDVYRQTFGIRSIEFSAEKGFFLNGESVLLKGGCLHHDNGYLGSAAIERAEWRKVELMKVNGFNAIRCAHNPPSEAFLNACDALGILVIDEFTDMWVNYKNKNDYSQFFADWWESDLTNMIMRDRNHPCIIMWSIGNEIPKMSISQGVQLGKKLVAKVKELDDTRPVTEAVTGFLIHGGWENSKYYFDIIDVAGYNYMRSVYESDHQKYPDRIIYSSESFPGMAYEYWKDVKEKPYVIGDFVWTAMDYIGEVEIGNSKYVEKSAGLNKISFQLSNGIPEGTNPELIFNYMANAPLRWPAYISGCGDLDLIGDKKPQGYYRDVLWDRSQLEMNVHEPVPEGYLEDISLWGWPKEWPNWNWKGNEGLALHVRIFTKLPHVKLKLNGKLIGEKVLTEDDKYIAAFEVPYQPGELTAIALENGKEIARKTLLTATEAYSIKLTADRDTINANRNDLSFIKIEVTDKKGNLILMEPFKIKISVTGNGELVGSGNANPRDMASVNNSEIYTYMGKAQAIIRPFIDKGEIKVKVSSDGLKSGELKIIVK